MPSNRRGVSRVMRPIALIVPSSGSGLRKRTVSSAVTPQIPGWAIVIARPIVSSRAADGDAAVQPAGVALVLLAGPKEAQQLAAVELVEAAVQAGRVLGPADEAHAADVLGAAHLAFQRQLLPRSRSAHHKSGTPRRARRGCGEGAGAAERTSGLRTRCAALACASRQVASATASAAAGRGGQLRPAAQAVRPPRPRRKAERRARRAVACDDERAVAAQPGDARQGLAARGQQARRQGVGEGQVGAHDGRREQAPAAARRHAGRARAVRARRCPTSPRRGRGRPGSRR